MSWEKVLKIWDDKFYEQHENIHFFGSFFDRMFGFFDNNNDIWRYVEKPWHWQAEYKIVRDALEILDYDDLGDLENYIDANELNYFPTFIAHVKELKQKVVEG
jgi:hypothetical protein